MRHSSLLKSARPKFSGGGGIALVRLPPPLAISPLPAMEKLRGALLLPPFWLLLRLTAGEEDEMDAISAAEDLLERFRNMFALFQSCSATYPRCRLMMTEVRTAAEIWMIFHKTQIFA